MRTIAVAGGTGTVGSALVKELVRGGRNVRVLTRNLEAAKSALKLEAVEFARVDFDAPDTLAAALQGADSAFFSMATSPRQVRDEKALIDAAVKAQVPWVVNLSVGGAGSGFPNNVLDWHAEIDRYLAGSGLRHTLLRPATFADTVFRVASGFLPHGLWGGTAGTGRARFIDTRDVADVAAAVLTQGAPLHAGQTYDLVGPDALSMDDMAGLLSRGLGRDVKYLHRRVEEQRRVYESAGLPPLKVDVLLGLDDLTRQNMFARSNDVMGEVTGRDARSLEAWVKENRARSGA